MMVGQMQANSQNTRPRAAALLALVLLAWLPPRLVHSQSETTPSDATPSAQMSRRIDELLDERLQEIGWKAAGECDDAAFLRRASLDLTGSPPLGSQVLDFLEEDSADKRSRLIDRLLSSSDAARHLAATWSDWLLPADNSANPFAQSSDGLQTWLQERFASNLRYDRLVADLLVASGPAESGPAAFYVALESKPEKIAAKTARVFMGVQLDCAECHDHPFDQWSQKDFWGYAAYFAQLSTNNEMAMQASASLVDVDEGDVMLPGTQEIVPPKPLVGTGVSGLARGTRRQQLTLWLTTRENPFLARATVNRVWSVLFGRGLIEPIDDMRSLEIASHPRLLAELSEYFASTGYDIRDLIATIAKTEAYGRATLHPSGPPPEASYATMQTKPLTGRQLSRTLQQVARQIADESNADTDQRFQRELGQLRGDASQAKLGIVAALVTLNGQLVDEASRDGKSRLLKALEAPYMDGHKQLRWLFLTTLNRPPTPEEKTAFSSVITEAKADDAASSQWQSDLMWALLNSTEFAMTP